MRARAFIFCFLLALGVGVADAQILSLPANPQFQNVYLRNATGCVDWDSGDITLCKTAANTLTLAGGQVIFPAGTYLLPSVAVGSAATGLFEGPAGAGDLAVTLAGSRRVRLFSTDVRFGSDIRLGFASGSDPTNNPLDTYWQRESAGVFQAGGDDAAPVNYTIKAANATGGGPTAGGSLTLRGGNPAGAAAYGDLIFQSAGGNIVWTPLQAAGALAGTLANSVALGDPTVYFKVKNGANFYAVPGWLIP